MAATGHVVGGDRFIGRTGEHRHHWRSGRFTFTFSFAEGGRWY